MMGGDKRFMEQLEILKNFLAGFDGLSPAIDMTSPEPGSCGLFPQGTEEISRREDVLGNVTCRLRQTYLLRRVDIRGEMGASFMLRLCQWAQDQPAPELGENTRIRWEKGRLVSVSQTGTATYEMKIITEYDKEL